MNRDAIPTVRWFICRKKTAEEWETQKRERERKLSWEKHLNDSVCVFISKCSLTHTNSFTAHKNNNNTKSQKRAVRISFFFVCQNTICAGTQIFFFFCFSLHTLSLFFFIRFCCSIFTYLCYDDGRCGLIWVWKEYNNIDAFIYKRLKAIGIQCTNCALILLCRSTVLHTTNSWKQGNASKTADCCVNALSSPATSMLISTQTEKYERKTYKIVYVVSLCAAYLTSSSLILSSLSTLWLSLNCNEQLSHCGSARLSILHMHRANRHIQRYTVFYFIIIALLLFNMTYLFLDFIACTCKQFKYTCLY